MALNYQSSNPGNDFTMIENKAFELSPNAYYLYAKLRKLDSDASNSIKVLMKYTDLNEYACKKAKKELIDKGWLATKQLYGNRYAFYIGKEAIAKYKYIEKKSKENKAKKKCKWSINCPPKF